MSRIQLMRRSYLLALLFSLLTCQFAVAASLIPDKSEISIGETAFIKLDADFILTIDWSTSPGIAILESSRKGATVKAVVAGPASVTAKINGKKKTIQMLVKPATTAPIALPGEVLFQHGNASAPTRPAPVVAWPEPPAIKRLEHASSLDVNDADPQAKLQQVRNHANPLLGAGTVSATTAGGSGWAAVETTPGMYRIERTSGQVRIARQGNNPGGLQYAGLRLERGLPATGDFDAQVSFADARIEGGLNQIELHASFADGAYFYVVRDREGSGSHIWAPGLQGNQPCGRAGTLRLERRGEMVTGFCDGRPIWSSPRQAALTKLQFVLQNNGTNDPISVTFHDFRFNAAPHSTGGGLVQPPAKSKRVLEDDQGPYAWTEGTEVQTQTVHTGRAAFRATGNNHFSHRLGIAGNYADQFRFLDFWIYLKNPSADIQLQVQVDGSWGKRWGFDGDASYNGYGWAMEGTTPGLPSGRWLHQRIDLLQQLHLYAGQAITGLAFSADGGDVYYDSVYLLPHENPTPPPRGVFSGKLVLEDDAGPYHWVEPTAIQKEVVAHGKAAFRSTGNNHFVADLGIAGSGGGQFRHLNFWAFFIGPEADIQVQVQVNGAWGKRWGYDAGPVYNGYGWAMEGASTHLNSGRWVQIQLDLIGQLHLNPGDKITGLAFSSDHADVIYDSVYLLPDGASAVVSGGFQGGESGQEGQTGGRDYTYMSPGGREYTEHVPVTATSAVLFDNGNIAGVNNGPSQPTTFSLDSAHVITLIQNYHWNSARGAIPGKIGLRDANGNIHGPWQSVGTPGQGGVPNAYWTVRPDITLPAGIYSVIDSHPASWSRNSGSQQRGFTRVEGYPTGDGQTPDSGRDYSYVAPQNHSSNPAEQSEPSIQEQTERALEALERMFKR